MWKSVDYLSRDFIVQHCAGPAAAKTPRSSSSASAARHHDVPSPQRNFTAVISNPDKEVELPTLAMMCLMLRNKRVDVAFALLPMDFIVGTARGSAFLLFFAF